MRRGGNYKRVVMRPIRRVGARWAEGRSLPASAASDPRSPEVYEALRRVLFFVCVAFVSVGLLVDSRR
jgi:hypothetical protein